MKPIHSKPFPKHFKTILTAIAIPIMLTLRCGAAAISVFDTSSEGWSTIGDIGSLSFSPTGGNPGGRLIAVDASTGATVFFVAPAKFLGNHSATYGSTLTFDILLTYSGAAQPFAREEIILRGAGLTLVFDSLMHPANGLWITYTAPLTEGGGWRLGAAGGPVPSQAQMQSVLANITSLQLRGEYRSGAEIVSLDNVRLGTGLPNVTRHQDFLLDPRCTYLRYNAAYDKNPVTCGPPLGPLVLNLTANGIVPGDYLLLERSGRFYWSAEFDTEEGRNVWAVFSSSATVDPNPPLNDSDLASILRIPGAVAPDFQEVAAINTGSTITDSPDGVGSPTNIDEDFMADRVLVKVPVGATHLMFGAGDIKWADNLDGDGTQENPPDFQIAVTQIRDPNFDTDGDGTSDMDEILSGTDYSNPSSRPSLAISPSPVPGNARTEWTAQPFRIYQVEESIDLSTWSAIDSPLNFTVPTLIQRDYPLSPTNRFFRLWVMGMFWD